MVIVNTETEAEEIRRKNATRIHEADTAKCIRRRRIEDIKMAREMGLDIVDIITRSKTAKYCRDKCRKAAYDKRRTDR